ncbi:dsDNA nuclease domain-containing protein [Pelomonas sp. Root1444]|uniref:CD-NTase-associated endodeoxyribonuclease Cap4 n=1 Tax=Pelomonas sp. Root1444 TaxID=1736464 RepID=UPI00070323C4|nr:dsDNA nuclease domain-containing protein [Pelomonas sp. Root1444]KQY80904.1 hypothetical protein ASD35_03395 [Pelomonas sp. Root1444]
MNSPLFERQATGGVVARVGFEYQDAYLLEKIPELLSQGAFSHVVSECLGDIELRYHRPSGGTVCTAIEAKRDQLTVNEVWAEVARFVQMHDASPDEFVRFVLVCGDYAGTFSPLFSKLDRLRGVATSLNPDSAILLAAQQEVEDAIIAMGQTASIARFVRERVAFTQYIDNNVSGAFLAARSRHVPVLDDMRGKENAAFETRCRTLIDQSVKGVVHRSDLEAALVQCAPDQAAAWLAAASAVQLLPFASSNIEQLSLDVGRFNGDARGQLGGQAWADLQSQIKGVADFLHASRARTAVALSAKQRMSLAATVGYCFSATRGFTLQMEHNAGAAFDTAKHDRAAAAFFTPPIEIAGVGQEGVVSISFPYPGRADVAASAVNFGLAGAPQLHIEGAGVIDGLPALNTAVHEAKAALVAFRAAHQLQRIHLFVKAPSVFAMALGHRLNGVGPIQLYDWVVNAYQPTALLTQ